MLSIKNPAKPLDRHERPVYIGLLLCGDVHDALQPRFGNYAQCLIKRLQLDVKGIRVKSWQVWKGELPENVMQADAYLVSGSPASVYDTEPWIERLGSFLRFAHQARRRLLGICFGHQMIHQALGGRVEPASGWGLGLYPVQLYQKLACLPDTESIALYAMHRDQVVIPAEGFEHLGGSEFCPYYLMRHTNRVLTLQGHPEFTREFFSQFLKVAEAKFDARSVIQAKKGMQVVDDSDLTCQLLNHFLLNIN